MANKVDLKKEMKQILIFHLQNNELGLDISCVREVLRPQDIHPLPQAPGFIEGVINLRKHIIAVVDLRKKLNIQPAEDKSTVRIIVCKIKAFVVGVMVDGVSEVLSLSQEDIQPPPAIVTQQGQGTPLSGIARVGERVISVLDLERILTDEEFINLSEMKK